MKSPSLRFLLVSGLLSSLSAQAAVVEITTEKSVGQGFIFPQDGKCLLATPRHVIDGVKSISLRTSTNEKFTPSLVKRFDIDLAMLSTPVPLWQCQRSTLEPAAPLATLLSVYDSGVLKTMVGDASLEQMKVQIITVEETESLQIRPSNPDDQLKQGQSGSILYIADVAVGMLIELYEGAGIVYRADALSKLMAGTASADGSAQNAPNQEKLAAADLQVGKRFSGKLATGETQEFSINLQANSPIEIQNIGMQNLLTYSFSILDATGVSVFSNNFYAKRAAAVAFTPKEDGLHTIKLAGAQYQGRFKIRLNQWALDSELTGASNVVSPGGAIQGKLATGTTSLHKMKLYENS
ncbi:MAG: hypothetical protein AB8G17_10370, partial [Gammaproteobacteria bacterium]